MNSIKNGSDIIRILRNLNKDFSDVFRVSNIIPFAKLLLKGTSIGWMFHQE